MIEEKAKYMAKFHADQAASLERQNQMAIFSQAEPDEDVMF